MLLNCHSSTAGNNTNTHQTYNLTNLLLEHVYLLNLYRTRKLTTGLPNGESDDRVVNLTVVLLYNSLLLKFLKVLLVIACITSCIYNIITDNEQLQIIKILHVYSCGNCQFNVTLSTALYLSYQGDGLLHACISSSIKNKVALYQYINLE